MEDLHQLLIKLRILAAMEDDPAKKIVFEESADMLQRLFDENQSLWEMLDELKASEIAQHNAQFEAALANLSSLLGSRGSNTGNA